MSAYSYQIIANLYAKIYINEDGLLVTKWCKLFHEIIGVTPDGFLIIKTC